MKKLLFLLVALIWIDAKAVDESEIENQTLYVDSNTMIHYIDCGYGNSTVILTDFVRYIYCDCLTEYSAPEYTIPSTFSLNGKELTVIGTDDYTFNYSPTEYLSLPPSMRFIGKSCFNNLSELKVLNFSENLMIINENCFNNMNMLDEITLPNSMYLIGNNCFNNNESLIRVDLGLGVRTIGTNCFCNNKALEEINISESARFSDAQITGLRNICNNNQNLKKVTLGKWASHDHMSSSFNGCPAIEYIVCNSIDPEGFTDCFDSVDPSKCVVLVPKGSAERYANTNWDRFTIKEMEVTGITEARDIDTQKIIDTERFTINGLKLSENSSDLNGKIIIEKNEKGVKKILISNPL